MGDARQAQPRPDTPRQPCVACHHSPTSSVPPGPAAQFSSVRVSMIPASAGLHNARLCRAHAVRYSPRLAPELGGLGAARAQRLTVGSPQQPAIRARLFLRWGGRDPDKVPGHRKIEGDIRRVDTLEANRNLDSLVDPAQCHVPAKFPAKFRAIRRTDNKGSIISADSDSPDRRFRVAPIRHLRVAPGEQHKVPACQRERRVIRRHAKPCSRKVKPDPPGEQPPSSSQFGSCSGVDDSAGATAGHGTAKPAARAAARHCRTVSDPVGSKNTPPTMSVPGGAATAKPSPAA